MSREQISSVLSKYVPAPAVEICSSWIVQKNIHLKITKDRSSKFGDYMPLKPGQGHRITVNHNLNPYSFLITFIHEVAHLHTYNNFRHFHEPHGKEWKNEFSYLLNDFILKGIFPDDIRMALNKYIANPVASSCTDLNLFRSLKKYDRDAHQVIHVEDIPENTLFKLSNSRSKLVFKKGKLIRSRFHCIEVKSNRVYCVSPMAEIQLAN